MASIQRIVSPLTKDVSYRAQVRVKGRSSESATFPNRKEAEAWVALDRERDPRGSSFPARRREAHELRCARQGLRRDGPRRLR